MTTITGDHISAMHDAQDRAAASTGNRAFPVRSLRDWQVNALKKLARLGLLKANWDSYGSSPIPDTVLDAAADLVSAVSLERVPPVNITPVSGGGVQFEWEKGARKLVVEVRPDLTFGVLLAHGEEFREWLVRALGSADLEVLLVWLDAR